MPIICDKMKCLYQPKTKQQKFQQYTLDINSEMKKKDCSCWELLYFGFFFYGPMNK
jgi:hypothetical protein